MVISKISNILQVLEDGRPFMDMAHVISCLNKFDAGVSDKICLMSRDEQNVLVVAYSELKICLDQSYAECVQSARSAPSSTAAAMAAAASQSSAVSLGMASALSSTHYLGWFSIESIRIAINTQSSVWQFI